MTALDLDSLPADLRPGFTDAAVHAVGVDYAWGRPGGAAIKARGFTFAIRYLSRDPSKNIDRAELADLRAHGLEVAFVWEQAADAMVGGFAQGAADAHAAEAQLITLGEHGADVYFAADWDVTAAEQAAVDAYLDGAASVLGARARTGLYGGYYVVKRALDFGKCARAWQTIAWSGGQWDSRAVLRQGNQIQINGVDCDIDYAMAADFGQIGQPAPRPRLYPVTVAMPMIGQGARDSADVRRIQGLLNADDPTAQVAESGFGPQTLVAVQQVQAVNHLTIDGIVGPKTWAALFAGRDVQL